jgi:hypothetical protein
VNKAFSSAIGHQQNISTHSNDTGYGGRDSGCSAFSVGGVASSCLAVYDEARSLAGGAMIVTLDVMVCFGSLGANNAPHLLASAAVMVTLDRTGCASIGGESPLLVDGARKVTPSGGLSLKYLLVVTSK